MVAQCYIVDRTGRQEKNVWTAAFLVIFRYLKAQFSSCPLQQGSKKAARPAVGTCSCAQFGPIAKFATIHSPWHRLFPLRMVFDSCPVGSTSVSEQQIARSAGPFCLLRTVQLAETRRTIGTTAAKRKSLLLNRHELYSGRRRFGFDVRKPLIR